MDDRTLEVRPPGRRALVVVVEDRLEVGRDCDGLLVVDPGVSRRHAGFEWRDGSLVVTDLGSTNGTLVNGRRIDGPTPVGPGDVVVVGSTELRRRASSSGASPVLDPQVTVGPGAWRVPPPAAADSWIGRVAHLAAAPATGVPVPAHDGDDGDTLTFCFSDIESSTEHALRLGDGPWYDLLAVHNGIVRNNLLRHHGTEVKAQGDGFFLTFPSARRGALFALDVQRAVRRWSGEHPDRPLRVRMGLHTGEALVSAGGDLFGKHVIIAARVADLAGGGETLVSHVTREIVSNRGDLAFGPTREVVLKGVDGPYQVAPLLDA